MANRIEEVSVVLFDSLASPKTSILATIGPSSFNQVEVDEARPSSDLVEEMVEAGMNLIRINLAHVNSMEDWKNVQALIARTRQVTEATKKIVGISVDLAGPKFRVAENLDGGSVDVREGERLILTLDPNYGVAADTMGTSEHISLDVDEFLIENVSPRQDVLIDDGALALRVVGVEESKHIVCECQNSWRILPKKGVNFPGCMLTTSAVTQKDQDDLRELFQQDSGIAKDGEVDFVSLSFVKTAEDIKRLRATLDFLRQRDVKIFAKIETVEAVDIANDYRGFGEILSAADGIMVARGDLGAELGILRVPEIQSELLQRAREARKPSIVATQMLESMRENMFPFRSEVNDVANAVREGADVVMLSAETSTGAHPARVVETMAAIALQAEPRVQTRTDPQRSKDFAYAIGLPIVEWADRVDASLIVVYTTTGYTAQIISHFRPSQPLVAITHKADAVRHMNLYWGIKSALVNYLPASAEEAKELACRVIRNLELAPPGETVLMSMSMGRIGVPGTNDTDTIHLFQVPDWTGR